MTFNLFQWIVDATQREPHWWGRQCSILNATCILLWASMVETWGAWRCVLIAVCLISIGLMWTTSRSAAWFARVDFGPYCRRVMWVTSILLFPVMDLTATSLSSFLSNAATAAFFSFAACRPPAPPKRRPSMRTAGGMT